MVVIDEQIYNWPRDNGMCRWRMMMMEDDDDGAPLSSVQCDQTWQNFATLANFFKFLVIFREFI